MQEGQSEWVAPYAQAARDFYMPQWVALNQQGTVTQHLSEAEAHIASMQRFLEILRMAVDLAPI